MDRPLQPVQVLPDVKSVYGRHLNSVLAGATMAGTVCQLILS